MIAKWQKLNDFLRYRQSLLITTHLHPDGDAIGSQIALAHFFRQQLKKVYVCNIDPTPKYFSFLDSTKEIMIWAEESPDHLRLLQEVEGVIVVDTSEWNRLGWLGSAIKRLHIPLACIDHHLQSEPMGQIQMLDQKASSTGEMVYDFLKSSNCRWTQEIVDALYMCVLTDTGSFRYSNTTPRAHRIAADLLQKGARFLTIYEQIYDNYSKERMILMGRLLTDLHFAFQDRLAYLVLSQALLREIGAQMWETEGFSELPRNLAGIEVSILFTEIDNGTTKVSIRSKGRININDLAVQLGGGGHLYAAGATLQMNLTQAIQKVLQEAEKLFHP